MSRLPIKNLEEVANWGFASSSPAYVFRPSTLKQIRSLLETAREAGVSIAFRGGGNSYGDAFSNREEVVLDLSRFKRILSWDPDAGIIQCQAGLTVKELWRYVLGDGWWPPIVTGTSKPTLGGCLAMNTHGKNGWQMGTIGDHVLEFEILLADGRLLRCSRQRNKSLFFAAIGGLGMLGCIVTLKLQLKKIYSGYLKVEAISTRTIGEALAYIEEFKDQSDYLVGWIDAMARGRGLGRGEMHRASYLAPGEDRLSSKTLQLPVQELSDSILGIVPKSSMWFYMRPFINNFLGRLVNLVRYQMAAFRNRGGGHHYLQSHASFHFLLDSIPNWKQAYRPYGLIQYQCFMPKESAEEAFTEIFQLCHERNFPNYLSVLKRHRPDEFLISYGVDGYSMAMDFKVTKQRRAKLLQLTHALDEIVLNHGGRFYLAKDSTLRPEVVCSYLGKERLVAFSKLKRQYDPENRFQSNMWRRLFMPNAA
ncbi:MAG: FAD-binding oxidoreductase [Chloroflexota bacterium]